MDLKQLLPYHLDVLKEIGNIGAGHAATSLSKLLKEPIDMSVPNVSLVSIQTLPNHLGGADTVVAAVYLRIEGDAPGSMFFLTEINDMEKLIRKLIGDQHFQLQQPPFDELGMSALQEVGNILAGAYLTSLSDFTKLNLQPSVPDVSIDMIGAILSFGLMPLLQVGDYAIIIETEIKELEDSQKYISGHFLFLPDPESFKVIFQVLGVETNE